MTVHTILYVSDKNRSTEFYKKLLAIEPQLDVPGMTEFKLSENHVLGLMPEKGIKKLLGDKIVAPRPTSEFPKAELYFRIDNPEQIFKRALELGAKELSPIQARDWGDRAGYVMDFDGYVLAFAQLQ